LAGVALLFNVESLVVFVGGTHRCQTNLFATKFDFKFISRFQVEQRCIGLADEKIAVALHSGHIAEFAAAFAHAANSTHAKTDAFGLQQCFIKSGEIQTFTTIFFRGDIATGTNKVRLADVTQVFDFIEKVAPSENRFREISTFTT
jgi:hypothetical protein